MRMLSAFILSVVLGCGLTFSAQSARALEIKKLEVHQFGLENKRPQVQVRFDLQADTWNAVTADPVVFQVQYEVKLKKSYALKPGSKLSLNLDTIAKIIPLQSQQSGNETFYDIVELKKAGNKLSELKTQALDTCQEIRGNGGKPNKDHVIQRGAQIRANVFAQTIAPWFTEESKSTQLYLAYDVVCLANPNWREPIGTAGSVTTDKGDFKVQSVDLFLTTYLGQETTSNPATSCKKLKVMVRIETNQSGVVPFKLWRQPGEPVGKSKMTTFRKDGKFKGRFILEEEFIYTFDKTTYAQYMVEVPYGPIGMSTPWKDITIHCGGGLTTGQPQGGGDLIPTLKVTKADIKIINIGGVGCPTKAFVTATFTTNKPGKFKYFIGTNLNKTMSGELAAKKVGAIYQAKETLTVDIIKSGKLTAHARPVDFPAASVFASKSFNCKGVDPVEGLTTQ